MRPNILAGITVAVVWIVTFGLFTVTASALDVPHGASWYDRWILRPLLLIWIIGGAFFLFASVGFGWFT